MRFSEEFEARFAEMLTHYPTKRSALVPTLLYAQDEVGSLSDEVIAELARRMDLTELEVRNVISYYSMLTTKPRGKYNVQVCTNIACMLRGGAGFSTGMKWSFVPKQSAKPKYVLCNGDESEPGTCKDRLIFEHDPHSVIEGVMIAAIAVGSNNGYIYIRGEYRYLSVIMQKAIRDAYAKGFLGKNIFGSGYDLDIYWHGGAGAYEVGEESALIESLEGKRGIPRIRPPFPAVVGLWGGPTVINNAETLAAVPHIILGGAEWFAGLGTPKNGGTRLFCLAGNLNKPGVYELPMGYNLKKMIYDVGGGIPDGRELKAVVPGGSSTPVLTI